MKKNFILLLSLIFILCGCGQSEVEMFDFNNSDNTLSCKIPTYMHKAKEDNSSLLFEGNKKFINIMWTDAGQEWNLEKFANKMTSGDLTLVEKNDSLISYEVRKGNVRLPALAFSLHKTNKYSVIVTTMGLGKNTREIITNSLK